MVKRTKGYKNLRILTASTLLLSNTILAMIAQARPQATGRDTRPESVRADDDTTLPDKGKVRRIDEIVIVGYG